MKKISLLLLGVIIALPTMSRDFTYTYEGQTITYTVIDETAKTCKVAANKVNNNLTIPSTAKDGDVVFTVTGIDARAFLGCSGLTEITIPNSVTSIGELAFYHCNSLTSITIPNSVTIIDRSVFEGCTSLTYVKIPNSVTSIEYQAFSECKALTSVELPSSLKTIGNSAFYRCTSLTSIEIPSSVTTIDKWAFEECTSVKSMTFEDGADDLTLIGTCLVSPALETMYVGRNIYCKNIPFGNCRNLTTVNISNSVTAIGDRLFWSCTGLTEITIPSSVTSICDYAFESCNSLTSITIPSSVTSIGNSVFFGCNGLTEITIPGSVTSIGDNAFSRCPSLNKINYDTTLPIKASKNIFEESTYQNATLYVAAGGLDNSKSTEPWMYFSKIKEKEASAIDEILSDGATDTIDYNAPYQVYNLNGIFMGDSTDGLTRGIYIVRQGSKVQKIAVR